MRSSLFPTKMFAVVQACALSQVAMLEKEVSSIWFRQAKMIWNVFPQIPSPLPTSVSIYFLKITDSLLPITLSRKPAFCVCGRIVSHTAVGWPVVYVLCHFSSLGFLARQAFHIPHFWLLESTLNTWILSPSQCLCLSICLFSSPFFSLLPFFSSFIPLFLFPCSLPFPQHLLSSFSSFILLFLYFFFFKEKLLI